MRLKGKPDAIRNILLEMTFVGGKAIFDAAGKTQTPAFCPHTDAAPQRRFYRQIAPERASAYFCRRPSRKRWANTPSTATAECKEFLVRADKQAGTRSFIGPQYSEEQKRRTEAENR